MERLSPQGGPSASGAYVPAIVAGGFAFVSGQGPLEPETGGLVGADLAQQTRATLNNVERVLAAAGASLADVVRVDAYLADLSEFDIYDNAFREVFGDKLPTRTTVGAVLSGILIEINAIAYVGEPA
jgi:2-iminobutanoate/2-iminopropanoate deaminase